MPRYISIGKGQKWYLFKKNPKKWNNRQWNNLVPESILVIEPKLWVETKKQHISFKGNKRLKSHFKKKNRRSPRKPYKSSDI